jgi:hypothetical protein
VSGQPVKLDYQSPDVAESRARPWPWFVIIPTVIGALCLVGVVDGLVTRGFPDEGPEEAAFCGILSVAFGLVGAALSLSRSRAALLCNTTVAALGIAGIVIASRL